jgi:glutaredoxin
VPPTVTLYRQPTCGLCDDAERLLAPIVADLGLRLETRDVLADDALFARYGMAIPVVEVDGVEVARAPIRASTLRDRLLDALSDRARAPR